MTERYLGEEAVRKLLVDPPEIAAPPVVKLPEQGSLVAGKYRIKGTLGAGGVAHVVEAHHELLDKSVALKFLAPEMLSAKHFESVAERFLVEARAAARVDSPYVARVMDVGTLESGAPFIVMERLEGCNLDELLFLETRLAVKDAVDYILQALQGLAHAHVLGVVHRDLKPANLFLAKQPDGATIVKVLDFGIAFVLDEAGPKTSTERETQRGGFVGSPIYMSPEQVQNAPIDQRTDIWSIGVVLYELVTGKVPFGAKASGLGELFGAILQDPLVPASKLREDVPAELDAVLAKALARDLDARYADVGELASALAPFGCGAHAHLAESIEQCFKRRELKLSGPDAFAPPAPAKRSTAWLWTVFALVAVLAGVAFFFAHRPR